ncbi:hypothetical protein Edno5_0058 [Edwardsiella phage Edno5]|uniref:DUF551 domain-containing protein n=1 Tax=Edwardsiella phage Edno5 TaxID=2419942 RepID=A0A3G3BYE1_9CAUD|nr:DUF551 domain-containing protein [Edwardsiella anguillarum]YP_010052869.1 DUF551 domain-containing protein [Edwardsiella phage Edno5]AYP69230.1 hypothetical protein Edno5_0058 [Edwardsiella phage Edno5]RFT04051.1 DUF551 domain-containing protein [Edwardsiella anguillarum]
MSRDDDGVYEWQDVRLAWLAWQAAQPKWIKCSERVPEQGGRYWCYIEDQNSLGKSNYQWNCSWNGDIWSDKELTGRVTHWMPLPTHPD